MNVERDRIAGFRGAFRLIVAAGIIASLQLESLSALAGVTSTTKTRYYNVSGTAKSTLARKMRNNPFSSPVMKSEFTQFACGATMITSIAVSPCISAMMAMARSTSD